MLRPKNNHTMRGITKLLLLCIFFTAGFACRKEKCVIVDKHTYTVEKKSETELRIFQTLFYYERDIKNLYYQNQTLIFSYSSNCKMVNSSDNNSIFTDKGEVTIENSTAGSIRVTFKFDEAIKTVDVPAITKTKTPVNDYPKNTELIILKVDYL
jgi:hypothetical protein